MVRIIYTSLFMPYQSCLASLSKSKAVFERARKGIDASQVQSFVGLMLSFADLAILKKITFVRWISYQLSGVSYAQMKLKQGNLYRGNKVQFQRGNLHIGSFVSTMRSMKITTHTSVWTKLQWHRLKQAYGHYQGGKKKNLWLSWENVSHTRAHEHSCVSRQRCTRGRHRAHTRKRKLASKNSKVCCKKWQLISWFPSPLQHAHQTKHGTLE